jgi:hypothetical protein
MGLRSHEMNKNIRHGALTPTDSMSKKETQHMPIYRDIYEQYYGSIPIDSDGRTYEIHHKER